MYIPEIMDVKWRTTGVTGIRPLPQVNPPVQTPMRGGYTIIQPGLAIPKPGPFTMQIQDLEDQEIKVWLYDWAMKQCSITDLSSFRREELMLDFTFYRLNSARQAVYKYEYQHCLLDPQSSDISDDMTSERTGIGMASLAIEAEFMIPTPLNIAS